MKIEIKLHRPYDRDPGDHHYGDLFDKAINELIGGFGNWSEPPDDIKVQNPKAKVRDKEIFLELHEDGPLIHFIADNIDQIPNYISAIASIISAWAAVRAIKKKDPGKEDYLKESGTIIKVGKNKFESREDLDPNRVKEVIKFIDSLTPKNTSQ